MKDVARVSNWIKTNKKGCDGGDPDPSTMRMYFNVMQAVCNLQGPYAKAEYDYGEAYAKIRQNKDKEQKFDNHEEKSYATPYECEQNCEALKVMTEELGTGIEHYTIAVDRVKFRKVWMSYALYKLITTNGDLRDFDVRLPPSLPVANNSELYKIGIAELCIPLKRDDDGFQGQPRAQVTHVCLHTKLPVHNFTNKGYTDILLKIPFNVHYHKKNIPLPANVQGKIWVPKQVVITISTMTVVQSYGNGVPYTWVRAVIIPCGMHDPKELIAMLM